MYAEPFRIMRFSSKKVTKRYAFEKTDVPDCSEYLEVKYSVRCVHSCAWGYTCMEYCSLTVAELMALLYASPAGNRSW